MTFQPRDHGIETGVLNFGIDLSAKISDVRYALDCDVEHQPALVRKMLYALRLIDVRQRLFRAENLIGDSQDRYVSIREAYLQHRQYLVFDGDPPVDDDFYDDFLEDGDADY